MHWEVIHEACADAAIANLQATAGGGSHPKALPAGMAIGELLQDHVPTIPGTHDNGNPDMESEFFDTRQVRDLALSAACFENLNGCSRRCMVQPASF